MIEAKKGFHFLPIFCNFTAINRNFTVIPDEVGIYRHPRPDRGSDNWLKRSTPSGMICLSLL